MDIVDKSVRSRMMSGIRSKDTAPEIIVRRFLHRRGFRYSLHDRKLVGRPDIKLLRYRTAIFVHGCFWHRHPECKFATTPSSNVEKWQAKFEANVSRDRKSVDALLSTGWTVIIIWECGLRGPDLESRLEWLPSAIISPSTTLYEWPSIDEKEGSCSLVAASSLGK